MTADPRAEKIIDDYLDATAGHCGCGCGHNGEPILDALAAAGWSLLPPGGQTRTEWGDADPEFEHSVRWCTAHWSRCRPHSHSRAVTTWPDGRLHYGPWEPVDTPEADRG